MKRFLGPLALNGDSIRDIFICVSGKGLQRITAHTSYYGISWNLTHMACMSTPTPKHHSRDRGTGREKSGYDVPMGGLT